MYGKFAFTSGSRPFEPVAVQIVSAQVAACLYIQGQPPRRVAVQLNHRKGYRNLGLTAGLLGKVAPSGLNKAFGSILQAPPHAVSRSGLPNGYFPLDAKVS